MNNIERFEHIGLPSKESFYSQLKLDGITDEGYEHATNVYNKFKCKKFLDYHLLYLKCDVLLLADIFENFRVTCQNTYKLDPLNYITSASLAWDAMLLKTNVEIGLISDIKLMDTMERGKRGGFTFVGTKRYEKFNNKYLSDYDNTKDSTSGLYLDANNLYGWAMSESLPYGDVKFDTTVTIEEVLNTTDDNDIGYFVEVDISFPPEMHELVKQFVPLPENVIPQTEWFSEYQSDLMESTNSHSKCHKLVAHLFEHKIMSYIIVY